MGLWLCTAVLFFGLQQTCLLAQEKGIPTLHVYTNTIQIPVLVLGPKQERITESIAAKRFWVSFDSGPWFHVTHVRPEGDDPISLSILLDVKGAANLMPRIDEAIASLAPLSLHAKDHVSIYALDCGLARSLNDFPADHVRLKEEVKQGVGVVESHKR